MIARRVRFAGLVLLAAPAACGYSLAGRGDFLPASIRTIGVPLFANQTPVFEAEQRLTERVRSEFIGRGRYRVLPNAEGADAVLTGTITSIAIVPASFDAGRQATRYRIVVTTSLEFRDVKADKVLWSNPAWQFSEEYDVTTGLSALDPNAFFDQDRTALDRLAQEFARAVVSAILEAF
jgi:hypothetical protein